MSTPSRWPHPNDKRTWTGEYTQQQQHHIVQVSAPGEVVQYVDHHPVTVPRQTAACNEHQLLHPPMTSRAEEESGADASRLGDDDLLQEAVRPLDDSVSTTPAADATNTRLITADLTHSDAAVTHSASASLDTVAAGDRQLDEVDDKGDPSELTVGSQQHVCSSVRGLNITSDTVSDTDNSALVLTDASFPLDLHVSAGTSVQESDAVQQTSGSTDDPHSGDTVDVNPACMYVHKVNVIIVQPVSDAVNASIDSRDLDVEFEEESSACQSGETDDPAEQMSCAASDPCSIGETRSGASVSNKR